MRPWVQALIPSKKKVWHIHTMVYWAIKEGNTNTNTSQKKSLC
jgi:hypothetical protein